MKRIKESVSWKLAKKMNGFLLHWFGFDLIITSLLVVGGVIIIYFGDRSDFDKLAVSIILLGLGIG